MNKMIAAFGLVLMLAFGGVMPANAQVVWNPTTAAGGAPVNPDYWDKRAAISQGQSQGTTNITVAPTQSNTVVNDYSIVTNTTDVQGGQTNVTAQGQLTNGGTFTVTTGSGSTTTTGPSSSTSNTVTSTSTLGDGGTVTNSTTTQTGAD